MDKNIKNIKIDTTSDYIIDINLFYRRGSTDSERGYYISVAPVKKQGNFLVYEFFSGWTQKLLEAQRYNQKTANDFIKSDKVKKWACMLVERVAKDNNLTITKDININTIL